MGSTSSAYDFNKTLKLFNELKKLNNLYHLFIFTRDDHSNVKNKIRKLNLNLNNNFTIKSLDIDEVIEYLRIIDFGFFFLQKNFSITASFPTKIAEFLSSGIPIITNDFNIHISELIQKNNIGFVDKSEKIHEMNSYINKSLNNKNIQKNCINISHEYLSINYVIKKYNKII